MTYHYGFSADIGGGEYERPIFDPSPRAVEIADPQNPQNKTSANRRAEILSRWRRRAVPAHAATRSISGRRKNRWTP